MNLAVANGCRSELQGYQFGPTAGIERLYPPLSNPPAVDIALHVATRMRSDPGPGAWAVRIVTKERSGTYSDYFPQCVCPVLELDAIISGLKIIENLCGTVSIHGAPMWIAEALSDGRAKAWMNNGWYTSNRTPVRHFQWWEELMRRYELRNSAVLWASQCDHLETKRCTARAGATLAQAKSRRNSQWRGWAADRQSPRTPR